MKKINPTNTISWKKLKKHFNSIKNVKISDLFLKEPNRFSLFSVNFCDQILIDYSKNRVTNETMRILLEFSKECGLEASIKDMFDGKKINFTEERAVLHTALRNFNNSKIIVDGKDIMYSVNTELEKMKDFCHRIINGEWRGFSGDKITDIVSIGIGGSNLGPLMVSESLRPYKNHLNIHFVSNVDGTHFVETTKKLNPETTLFLISSKTFSTQETITNAYSAKNWFLKQVNKTDSIDKHFIAISSNKEKALKFGINIKNIFKFWDWVGGRYSLWSSLGLPIALSIGFENFKELLYGAYKMDQHFLKTPLDRNLPVILALLSIWYSNFFRVETEAVVLYDQYMHKFPEYLQQLSMESIGKCIDRSGYSINYQTGSIIWGGIGTNVQHSFYQLMHQGTKIIPCDFIAPIISHNPIHDHHTKLLSNFFGQTEALAFGKSKKIIKKELKLSGKTDLEIKRILPFMVFKGNRPTNSILLRKISPNNLGSLIALYEHKVFVQGVLLNINSFDQWGVDLGKKLSSVILNELKDENSVNTHDSSTNGLINYYKYFR